LRFSSFLSLHLRQHANNTRNIPLAKLRSKHLALGGLPRSHAGEPGKILLLQSYQIIGLQGSEESTISPVSGSAGTTAIHIQCIHALRPRPKDLKYSVS
jgi:hypothetical protein